MKTFYLQRNDDESGVSGTGKVAQGVQFDDGTCAMRWLTKTSSTATYNSIDDLESIHGHNGKTVVVFETSKGKLKDLEDLKKKAELQRQWNYEFETWKSMYVGFDPIELVSSIDNSEPYTMNKMTIFKNTNGSYVIVSESGCSCYEPSNAHIDFVKTKKEAMTELEKFRGGK